MNIIMFSLDKTLINADYSGDVLERHRKYAQYVDKLDIIVFSKKGFYKQEIDEKLTVYPTNSLFRIFYFWDAYRIAKKIVDRNSKTLVVAPFMTALAGWFLKVRFGFPLLIHFHGDFWQNNYWLLEKKRWWFNWFFLWLSKFLVERADGVRVVSLGIKKKLLEEGVGVDKIRVIPTPVDLKTFENYDYAKAEERKGAHENLKTIINVGRNDSSKDYKTLYKTIKSVCEGYGRIAFCQVGASLRLSDKINPNKVVLNSIGKIEQKELANHYHASDIYVSSSRHESFGKVLIEAMACGLPVVATATTGSKDIIIDGENGFLVPVGDSEALARKIIYLLNNPDMAKKWEQPDSRWLKKGLTGKKLLKK